MRHYTWLRNNIEKELLKGIAHLRKMPKKTPLDYQVISLADFMIEISRVVVSCFKEGYISSGLHQLRMAQEVAHKMGAMRLRPRLADKEQTKPGNVRKILEEEGLPHWKDVYKYLSDISHQNKNFMLGFYGDIRKGSKPSRKAKALIESHLMVLNIFSMKALYVLFKQLEQRLSKSSYLELVNAYRRLDDIAESDWDTVDVKAQHADWWNSANEETA